MSDTNEVQPTQQPVHAGESVSSRVYELLRTFPAGRRFTSLTLSQMIPGSGKACGAFLTRAHRAGMIRVAGLEGRAVTYEMVNPDLEINIRSTPSVGGVPGRRVVGRNTAPYLEARGIKAVKSFCERRMELACEIEGAKPDISKFSTEELAVELSRRVRQQRF